MYKKTRMHSIMYLIPLSPCGHPGTVWLPSDPGVLTFRGYS